jgi:hypothetical protein
MTEIISPDNQLVDDSGISTQRTQIWLDQVTDLQIITGTGTPEGSVSANVSRLYLQTDGTDGAVLFIKQLSDIGGDPKYGWVVCGGGGSASIALEDLTDVTITSIATGELLKWNGSAWVNNTLSEAGVQPEEDQRLSTTDSVEFLSVTTGNVIATGNITVTGTVDGRDIAVDGIKLDGIEAGADVTDTDNVVASLTAGANITIAADGTISATSSGGNETLAETLALGNTTGGTDISVSTGDNIVVATGSTVDGRDISVDGTKLDGIEAGADVTDTANVTAAGALMDSEVVNLDQVKNFDSADYATAAQGVTADNALPLSGGTMTGVIANFESTGIDDNATSTQLTISDTSSTFAGDVILSKTTLTRIKGLRDDTSISDNNGILSIDGNGKTPDGTEVTGVRITIEGDGTWTDTSAPTRLNFNTTSVGSVTPTEALVIDSSQDATFAGDINFSGAAPNVLLDADNDRLVVSGGDATSSGANIIFYGDNHASAANKMIFRNSATTALTINASQEATFAGNVTTTGAFQASGLSKALGGLEIFSSGVAATYTFTESSTSGYTTNFHMDNTGFTISGNSGSRNIAFATNSIDRLTISGTGTATFAGEIDASAGGIYLGGTAAANHLDDYEEGTWTPTNYSGGGAYNAKYIKIGNLVTVSVYFNGGTFTTNNIGGLPFSPSTSNRYVAGLIGYTDTTNVTGSYTQTSSRLYFVNKVTAVTPNNDRMMIQVSYFVGI